MTKELLKLALEALEPLVKRASPYGEQDWLDGKAAIAAIREALAAPQYTYTSTQATKCAQCGKHKHTPLRIDAMDGYVCLTCIDKKLGTLLGEFGYPEALSAPQKSLKDMTEADFDEAHGIKFDPDWEQRATLRIAAPAPLSDEQIMDMAIKSPLRDTYWLSPKLEGYQNEVIEITSFARAIESHVRGEHDAD